MGTFSKVAGFIVLVFVLYAIFTNPVGSAGFVQSIFQGLANGIASITRFFDAVMA